MKVYICLVGDWDGDFIEGVYSSRDAADHCARRTDREIGKPFVEEWDVEDTFVARPLEPLT